MAPSHTLPASLVDASAVLERVATGCTWSEGPVWVRHASVLRWSDIPNDRLMQFDPATGQTSVHRSGNNYSNGHSYDPIAACVVQCSHGNRCIEREIDGRFIPLVDSWQGSRLNSPNDIVVKSDGTIWFSDPAYGITVPGEGHPGEQEYGDCYVFRFDPKSGELVAVVTDVEAPNGLAFSPDESLLYVSDTSAARQADGVGNHHIRAYDVQDGHRCKNGRTLITLTEGLPDGFRVDAAGNIWTSSAIGVLVYDAHGQRLGEVPVPETVSNVAFGGDGHDLYITATTSLYRLRTHATDAAAVRT